MAGRPRLPWNFDSDIIKAYEEAAVAFTAENSKELGLKMDEEYLTLQLNYVLAKHVASQAKLKTYSVKTPITTTLDKSIANFKDHIRGIEDDEQNVFHTFFSTKALERYDGFDFAWHMKVKGTEDGADSSYTVYMQAKLFKESGVEFSWESPSRKGKPGAGTEQILSLQQCVETMQGTVPKEKQGKHFVNGGYIVYHPRGLYYVPLDELWNRMSANPKITDKQLTEDLIGTYQNAKDSFLGTSQPGVSFFPLLQHYKLNLVQVEEGEDGIFRFSKPPGQV